ncbi:MmpS family transport accessory protein [Mycobacterium paraintracellulare]|uniref:MmpS family transport accessory protein n=1 Tax=Mycobacterium paraintracellulare TaxID=1138383 RepID=UPI0019166CBE|nr:MmpS family transport accessory protein [Mycobacterium paraintracellulare]
MADPKSSPRPGVLTRVLQKAWIPLLLVVVLALSALVVSRLHKLFGSEDLNANAGKGIEIVQFNPKVVVYEISGAPGTTANINYWDENANTHQVDNAPLPWSTTINCKITVDGVVRDNQNSDGHNAQTFCLVKSA